MLDCLILGDSIAVGTALYAKQCTSYSIGGYNTWQWNKKFPKEDLSANTVIISLGTNDHQYVKTEKELRAMRERVKGSRVYWIMPSIKPNIQTIVEKIATEYKDNIVAVPPRDLAKDGIHPLPRWYKMMGEYTK